MKFCQVAPSRKMILRVPAHVVQEKCTSADYTACPAAKEYHEEFPIQDRCPFLQESLTQYCAGAPVIKFLPYSESILSRCGNDSHLYCEVYLDMANPDNQGLRGDTLQNSPEESGRRAPYPGLARRRMAHWKNRS